MKKSLFVSITLICLAFIFHAHAQIVSDDSGNVGIGVSNPSTELEVNGVITTTGGDSDDWNSVFGWGDHSTAGYLTSEVDGSTSNELQNVFSTVTGDTGTTTADAQADTLTVVGSGTVSTAVSGDTLTITGTGGSGGGVTTYFNSTDVSTYGLTLVGDDYLGARHTFITSLGFHYTISYYGRVQVLNLYFSSADCAGTTWTSQTTMGPGSVAAAKNNTEYYYLPKSSPTPVTSETYLSRWAYNSTVCVNETSSPTLTQGWQVLPNVPATTGINPATLPPGTTYWVTH